MSCGVICVIVVAFGWIVVCGGVWCAVIRWLVVFVVVFSVVSCVVGAFVIVVGPVGANRNFTEKYQPENQSSMEQR